MATLEERFWAKVQKTDGCWLWTAATSDGYGMIAKERPFVGAASLRANRVAYELHYGPIPTGEKVRHTCDVPACVRPDHLILGSQADNMQDASERERFPNQHKTHCAQGHSLENAAITQEGWRRCRICARRWVQESRDRKKSKDAVTFI